MDKVLATGGCVDGNYFFLFYERTRECFFATGH